MAFFSLLLMNEFLREQDTQPVSVTSKLDGAKRRARGDDEVNPVTKQSTVLIEAIRGRMPYEEVERMATDCDLSTLNAQNWKGESAIFVAADTHQFDVVLLLNTLGCALHSPEWPGRKGILHLACYGGHAEVVNALLSTKDKEGVAKLLSDLDVYGLDPVQAMIENERASASLLFALTLKWGYDVETKDKKGRTLLYRAVNSGSLSTVLVLMGVGANVRTTNDMGVSPLEKAVYGKKLEVARLLTESGAKVASKSALKKMEGLSPLEYAKRKSARARNRYSSWHDMVRVLGG